MLTKNNFGRLIVFICCLELAIYFWSDWTATFDRSNYFAIQPQFIFAKCARIAGRISSILILIILLMVGYFGLNKIYKSSTKLDSFLILITLFSINHFIHFLFVMLNLRSMGEAIHFDGPIETGGIIHGFITFICIALVPIILWKYKTLSKPIYSLILLHLFNVSSFITKTFQGKVKPPEHPAYHNQFGILVIVSACFYILYRVYKESQLSPNLQ